MYSSSVRLVYILTSVYPADLMDTKKIVNNVIYEYKFYEGNKT